jgi:transposase
LYALILLACDEGSHQQKRSINETISRVLQVSMKTIDRVKKQFVEKGLEAVMTRKPTSRVFAKKVDGDLEAKLIALSCSPAPEGHARWTLRLLADKVVELNYVDEIFYETVRRTLKKTSSSRGRRKDG